jgi:uncharacterized membrane protein
MARWTEIADANARAALASYFSKIDRGLAPLPRDDANEIRNELEAHVLDAFAAAGAGETAARTALAQMGDPDEFLPALVADRLRARAGRTMRPGDVFAALARSGASGAAGLLLSTLVGLGYVVAALCVVMGLIKLAAPDSAGIYRLHNGGLFIGIDDNVQGVDLLGIWFSPIAIAVGTCLYLVLTWAFGRATLRSRPTTTHAATREEQS